MNIKSGFDAIAPGYDHTFSRSLIGEQQRSVARRWLSKFLEGKGALRILEINCGTGEDALWLASLGHEVIATDQSEVMIREAEKKALPPGGRISFLACGFSELEANFQGRKFDLIFSNFSGLNCVPPGMISGLGAQFFRLLEGEGHLAVVLFGKYSWMETFYFLGKRRIGTAFRRWSDRETEVQLEEGVIQPVHYYSVSRFVRLLGKFQLLQKYPVGLFIPPSYLEGAIQRRRRLFRLLVRLENLAGHLSGSSQLADHTYILLKKR